MDDISLIFSVLNTLHRRHMMGSRGDSQQKQLEQQQQQELAAQQRQEAQRKQELSEDELATLRRRLRTGGTGASLFSNIPAAGTTAPVVGLGGSLFGSQLAAGRAPFRQRQLG